MMKNQIIKNNQIMTEEAIRKRREYQRNYYAKNKERIKGYAVKYWNTVAELHKNDAVSDAEGLSK